MKRLLFYSIRSGTSLGAKKTTKVDFYVEQASSLSQVFHKELFRTTPSVENYRFGIFLLQVDEPNIEIADFIRYIRKYCRALSVVVMSGSKEAIVILKHQLKDTGCRVMESNYIESVLNQLK